jgi:hypothetical protein
MPTIAPHTFRRFAAQHTVSAVSWGSRPRLYPAAASRLGTDAGKRHIGNQLVPTFQVCLIFAVRTRIRNAKNAMPQKMIHTTYGMSFSHMSRSAAEYAAPPR